MRAAREQEILAPKRAMSAYMLFGQHIRADIVKENPEIKARPAARNAHHIPCPPLLPAPQASLPVGPSRTNAP